MAERTILLVRHPETEANAARRYLGRTESPFTERGAGQAAALIEAIAAFGPSLVLASPRERAISVARPAAEKCGCGFRIEADLDELDFGQAEGKTYEEAWAGKVAIGEARDPGHAPFEDGETWGSWRARMGSASRTLLEGPPTVAVVAHAGTVRGIIAELLGLPTQAAWRFRVRNATLSVVSITDGWAALESFGLSPEECADR